MNDEQIRDSLRTLAAAAPNVDIWSRISGQVESQSPRRPFWPHLRLRPLLVGLNAMAIALLLFMMFGPLGLNIPATEQSAPHNQAITTPGQAASHATQQVSNGGQGWTVTCNQSSRCLTINENGTPIAGPNITHTFTLTDFAQYMGSEPTFLLPAVSSTNYRMVGDITTGFYSYQVIGLDGEPAITQEPSRYQWMVSYRDSTNPADIKDLSITTNANLGQSTLGDEGFVLNTKDTSVPQSGQTGRYQRSDRLIELYYDAAGQPDSQIAYVYFLDPQHSQRILTTYILRASYNVSNDELLKMADSIERVDPQHLERYQ